MLGIPLSNSAYNLLGHQGQIIQLLCKKLSLCSDRYIISFQCWACCHESDKKIDITCFTTFNSNCQTSINNKIDSSFNCRKCRDPGANIERLSSGFTKLSPMLVIEVGHINDLIKVQDF